MGVTKFQEYWKKNFDWVRSSKKSVYAAICLPCNDKELDVKAGINVLERHEKRDTHSKNYKLWKTVSLCC